LWRSLAANLICVESPGMTFRGFLFHLAALKRAKCTSLPEREGRTVKLQRLNSPEWWTRLKVAGAL